MIDLDKVSEGVHYELVPVQEDTNLWHVRILKGEFTETVIEFGTVKMSVDHDDEPYLKFDFSIIKSPDDSLDEDNISLQDYSAVILEDIMSRGIVDGSVALKEK